jgi:hypothetical protein
MSVLDQDAPLADIEPTEEQLYALTVEPDVVWLEDDDAEEDYQPQTNGWDDYNPRNEYLDEDDDDEDDDD